MNAGACGAGLPACASPRSGGKLRRIAAMFAMSLCLVCVVAAGTDRYGEYQVKAAFVYHFTKFVEWPPAAFASTTAPFVVGVLGDDPFGDALDRALAGKTVKGRKIVIERFKDIPAASRCHVLFISASEKSRVPVVVENLHAAHVLTVSDIENFARMGGMVGFVEENTHIRFDINAARAQQAGLEVSSKLLALARSTQRPGQPEK